MKVGSFEVPEFRLIPNALDILETIYKKRNRDKVNSKQIAIDLGYKYGTESHFYRRLKTLLEFGLLEGSGSYCVSELGEKILRPKDEHEKNICKTQAVLNVGLWKNIYDQYKKDVKEDNFWPIIVDITKISRDKAVELNSKLFKWYTDDMAHLDEKLVGVELAENTNDSKLPNPKSLRSGTGTQKPEVDEDMESIIFDRYTVILPKGDLKEEWETLKSYMDIKLKNYKYKKPSNVVLLNKKEHEKISHSITEEEHNE